MRKSQLKSKRDRPRIKRPERTAHLGRMKRKAVSKTEQEARHLARVATLPCLVTGRRPVAVHHLMKAPDKRCRRDHRWVVPLIPELHNGDAMKSVHGLGTESMFEVEHGLAPGYLVAWARQAWEGSCAGLPER